MEVKSTWSTVYITCRITSDSVQYKMYLCKYSAIVATAYTVASICVPSSRWEVKFLYWNAFTKSAEQNTKAEIKTAQKKKIILIYKIQRLE